MEGQSGPPPGGLASLGRLRGISHVLSLGLKRDRTRTTARSPTGRRKPDKLAANGQSVSQGAIRFPGSRRPPAKWAKLRDAVRIDADMLEKVVGEWRLRPPTALFSVVGLTPEAAVPGSYESMQQISLRRGLRRAALKTNAWIVTSGTAQGDVGGWVGMAIGDQSEVPVIGVLPWRLTAEHEQLEWSSKHLYGNYPHAGEWQNTYGPLKSTVTGGLARSCTASLRSSTADLRRAGTAQFPRHSQYDESDSGCYPRAPTTSFHQRAWRSKADAGHMPLDKRHSHYFLIDSAAASETLSDAPSAAAAAASAATAVAARWAFEDHICAADLADIGQATPMLTVLVNGDAASLEMVLSRLQSGAPVCVFSATGGAAYDLAMWEEAGGELSSSEDPEGAYEARATELIPQILAYARDPSVEAPAPSEPPPASVAVAAVAERPRGGLTKLKLAELGGLNLSEVASSLHPPPDGRQSATDGRHSATDGRPATRTLGGRHGAAAAAGSGGGGSSGPLAAAASAAPGASSAAAATCGAGAGRGGGGRGGSGGGGSVGARHALLSFIDLDLEMILHGHDGAALRLEPPSSGCLALPLPLLSLAWALTLRARAIETTPRRHGRRSHARPADQLPHSKGGGAAGGGVEPAVAARFHPADARAYRRRPPRRILAGRPRPVRGVDRLAARSLARRA